MQFINDGFEWCEINDYQNSVLSFLRFRKERKNPVLVVCNLTPVVRENYRVGVPNEGDWTEILNSDDLQYGGSGVSNSLIKTEEISWHGKPYSLNLKLPPLGAIYFQIKNGSPNH